MKKKIAIDAGHGGNDNGGGGSTKGYFLEDDKVLQISLYQKKRLEELGFEVFMTRTTDIGMTSTKRANKINAFNGNLCISNHTNACGADGAEIIETIHKSKQTNFPHILKQQFVANGQNVRRIFSKSYNSNPNIDYYFMIRLIDCESYIIEYGFGDSSKDDQEQLKNDWKILAESVIKSICLYYDTEYKLTEEIEKEKTITNVKDQKFDILGEEFTNDCVNIDGHIFIDAEILRKAGLKVEWKDKTFVVKG